MTTTPIAFPTTTPRTDEERVALLDAMLEEMRQTENRMEARSMQREKVWHEIETLKAETRAILSSIKRDR